MMGYLLKNFGKRLLLVEDRRQRSLSSQELVEMLHQLQSLDVAGPGKTTDG